MTFGDRHSEYLWLTVQLFGNPGVMAKDVWDKCDDEAQEMMLESLRKPLRERQEREQRYLELQGVGGAW